MHDKTVDQTRSNLPSLGDESLKKAPPSHPLVCKRVEGDLRDRKEKGLLCLLMLRMAELVNSTLGVSAPLFCVFDRYNNLN